MVLYAPSHTNHPQMNLRERYLVYLLIIEQWIIWIGYLIWTLSYAKLFFIGRLLVFNGRQGRMINAVSCSRKRRELSAMTRKFGRLLIRFSHSLLIFVWVWYRIGKGQSAMILIALRWIYLGGRCYRIQVGFVSFVFIRLVFLFWTRALSEYSECCLFCSWCLGEHIDIHCGTSSLYRISRSESYFFLWLHPSIRIVF